MADGHRDGHGLVCPPPTRMIWRSRAKPGPGPGDPGVTVAESNQVQAEAAPGRRAPLPAVWARRRRVLRRQRAAAAGLGKFYHIRLLLGHNGDPSRRRAAARARSEPACRRASQDDRAGYSATARARRSPRGTGRRRDPAGDNPKLEEKLKINCFGFHVSSE